MTKLEKIIDLIQEMNKPDVIALHNEYCYATNNYDDEIMDSDRLNEICNGQDAEWVANRVYFGEYHPQAEYIKFNGYGNFKSIFNYEVLDYIDENEIANYIIDNDIDFEIDNIRYILDDIEKELKQ